MSYALVFAPEARAVWERLDIWLQELVIDEVDRLASDPQHLARLGRFPSLVQDVVQARAGETHYVFLVLDRNDSTRELTIQRMGYVRKPSS